jgi:hypothetical protein
MAQQVVAPTSVWIRNVSRMARLEEAMMAYRVALKPKYRGGSPSYQFRLLGAGPGGDRALVQGLGEMSPQARAGAASIQPCSESRQSICLSRSCQPPLPTRQGSWRTGPRVGHFEETEPLPANTTAGSASKLPAAKPRQVGPHRSRLSLK